MNRHVLPLAARAAAALCLVLTTACLFKSESHTRHEGRYVSSETLERVRPGSSREYVLALLGEPSTRTPFDQGSQIWKWQYKTTRQGEGRVFLILKSDRKVDEVGAVYVEFQDDEVVRTWRD